MAANSGHFEFWRSPLTNGYVVAYSLITITDNHAKNPATGTNNVHASHLWERPTATLAPIGNMGNTNANHLNRGVAAK